MKKIAVYCRVSTDKEDQAHSLDSQKRYFQDYIKRQPEWELWQVYADEGISGTSTKNRHAFLQMLRDAEAGCFDLVVTKEISRFARNTLDSIFYTRRLKELGVGVFFLNDNINTLDADAELRLTIMASIAQEESRKTSERVKWGQKRRMEQGVVFGRSLLGYDVKDGKISVNQEGAEIVRRIFYEFVCQKKGSHVIAKDLRAEGAKTAQHTESWTDTAILRILQNEKYTGDLIQKKTYTPNFLTHEKKDNQGEEELVICRQHHPALISQDLFQAAQEELARRRGKQEHKGRHSGRYCFSGKIQCGYCGAYFTPRQKKRKDGSIYLAWRCSRAAQGQTHPGTYGRQISHRSLLDLLVQTLKGLTREREAIKIQMSKILLPLLEQSSSEYQYEKLQRQQKALTVKKERLLELYINREIAQKDFLEFQKKYEDESNAIHQKLQELPCFDLHTAAEKIEEAIDDILSGDLPDEAFYNAILDKIIIQDKGMAQVYFKSMPPYLRHLRP